MNILINGTERTTDASSIEELLLEQGYEPQGIAVALNGEFVPKSTYAETRISAADDIEVVSPMQGG